MPPSDSPFSLQEQKQHLRDEMRVRRLAASQDNKKDSKALADIFGNAVQLAPGAIIAGYRPFRGELDPSVLLLALRARGHKIALPIILGKRMPLDFHLYEPGDRLIANAMGIHQPSPNSPLIEPDVLLVPLLAFDRQRNRLGYGGGYYDRTISDIRTRKEIIAIGIGYSWQEVTEVPAGPNDISLDKIVTEVNSF